MTTDTTVTSWTLPGADGQTVAGDTHAPTGALRGVAVIAHGFKGYKDYGMFPAVAAALADAGLIAHRFNFSHSGMTGDLSTFARPDLFERDTWNRQVADLRAVAGAIGDGRIAGADLPLLLLGHSRGGVSVLLTAGRHGAAPEFEALTGVITVAAPATCNSLPREQAALLLRQGHLVSPSSRTGQDLRVGRAFLQEQLDDPAGHDLLAQVARVRVPILVIHGAEDPTVPPSSADAIVDAARDATKLVIAGGDHVLNTPNPFPPDGERSPQLAAMLEAVAGFAGGVAGRGGESDRR